MGSAFFHSKAFWSQGFAVPSCGMSQWHAERVHAGPSARAQVFPGRSEETYMVPLTREVWIEETDFREADVKGYYGLAPGKSAMLK